MDEKLRLSLVSGLLGLTGLATGDLLWWLTDHHDLLGRVLPIMLAVALLLPARVDRA